MSWIRHSDYGIKRGDWMIGKFFIDGATLYVLHDVQGVRYGHFESAEEAKQAAKQMEDARGQVTKG